MDFDLKRRLSPRILVTSRDKPTLWIHCASVGEFNTVKPLLPHLRDKYFLFLTYFSPRAKKYLQGQDAFYDFLHPLPLDFPPVIRKVEKQVRPVAVIIVEREIWPSMILSTRAKKFLINAQFRGRILERFLAKRFDLIITREEDDRKMYLRAGAREVVSCGNLKLVQEQSHVEDPIEKDGQSKLVVAGSTHDGEEKIILDALKKTILEGRARLVIAPRHIDRSLTVLELSRKSGLSAELKSSLKQDWQVLVVDTLGELKAFYSIADVAIVGGTFVPVGGHNLFEPAYFGKPVLFGPYTRKVSDVARFLISVDLGFRVEGANELKEKIIELLEGNFTPKIDARKISDKVKNCYLQALESKLEK